MSTTAASGGSSSKSAPAEPSALVVLVDGVEELEAVAPIDCLRRAGVSVTVAAAAGGLAVTGRNGIGLAADRLLAECADARYGMVVIPGGPGHAALARDGLVLELLRRQHAAGGWVAAICAGPVVLAEAGLLEGRAYTCHPSAAAALPERDPARAVVRDGRVITSQGAGTAIAFALELVAALRGEAARRQVAGSICA